MRNRESVQIAWPIFVATIASWFITYMKKTIFAIWCVLKIMNWSQVLLPGSVRLWRNIFLSSWGRCGRDSIVVGFTTTNAISAYHHWCRSGWGVQHYVIKFVSDLRQVSGFLRVLRFPPPIKHCNDITEILLKVVLKTPSNKLILWIKSGIDCPPDKGKSCRLNSLI